MQDHRPVVRLQSPRRRRSAALFAAGVVLLLGFGLFEFGQRLGGRSLLESDRARAALAADVARLEAEKLALQEQLARAQTRLEVDQEAHEQLRESLASSESRLAALDEELQFYRRIVVPPEGRSGLRVRSFEVRPGDAPRDYRLSLLVVQNPQRSGRAEGRLELRLQGRMAGEEASLALAALGAAPQAYEFLYFQDLEFEVTLPEGFAPESADVTLHPEGRSASVVEAGFPWVVQDQD